MAHFTYKTKAGVKVPSVTQMLGQFKDPGPLQYWAWDLGMKGINFREQMDKAADIGTIAHKLAECHMRGLVFDPAPYDAEALRKAQVPFGAFLEWAGGSKLTSEASEVPMVSEKYGFGGCMDVVFVNGRRQISDLKTSKDIYPEFWAQVLGYSLLWRENFPDKPVDGGYSILRFGKLGDFSHHWLPPEHPSVAAAERYFLGVMQAYKAKQVLIGKATE